MRRLEKSHVEAPVIRWCRKHHPEVCIVKMNTAGNSSYPDRMFLCPGGQAIFLEFKSPDGGVLSLGQTLRIAHLRKLGFMVGVFDDSSIAIEALREVIENGKTMGT